MSGITNSIVVVNFNTKAALLSLLKTLALHEATSTEVIVVDSASFDGSADAVRAMSAAGQPLLKLLPLSTNRGFFHAANQGIDRAQSEVVVLCHADVITDVHTLAELGDQAREAESRKAVAVVPRLVGVDGAEQPFVGKLPKLATALAGELNPRLALSCQTPVLDHVAEHEWARFACVAFNRNYLATVGMFDEKFFLYFGDTDLCARIHARQLRVLISKTVKVTHAGVAAGKDVPEHLLRILRKDQQHYAKKHLPQWQHGMMRAAGAVRGWMGVER